MKEFQRNHNTIVIHYSNTDLGGNSNFLIFKVIVIYYTDLGGISKSNIAIFKILIYYTNLPDISNGNSNILRNSNKN